MERLDGVRMFVAVVDCGSFAEAARRLGTSSGQASKLVARLEADLGVQLLKRTTRALSPTEAGQAYHLRMKELLTEFDATDQAVRRATGTPSGRLKVTAPLSFGNAALMPVLVDFTHAWPEISLDVAFSDRTVDLVEEGFDMAVRIGFPQDSSLVARRLCMARFVTVAAPSWLTLNGTPRVPQDLIGRACIIDTNFPDPTRWTFADGSDLRLEGRLVLSNADACLTAAEAGLGVARIPSFLAGPSLREGRLIRLMPEQETEPRPVMAVYPPARHLALKVRALVDHLADAWKGVPEWDRGW